MKQGFTLIEVLIATVLASVISVILLLMWQNMNQIRTRVDQTVNLHERVARLYAQLDRDISGAFVPVEADMSQAGIADTSAPTPPKSDQKTEQKQEQKPEQKGG